MEGGGRGGGGGGSKRIPLSLCSSCRSAGRALTASIVSSHYLEEMSTFFNFRPSASPWWSFVVFFPLRAVLFGLDVFRLLFFACHFLLAPFGSLESTRLVLRDQGHF